MKEPLFPNYLFRRRRWALGVFTASTVVAGVSVACGGSNGGYNPTFEVPSTVVTAPTPTITETILENRRLMPEVFPGRTISSARVAESISYLGRVADELHKNPQFIGTALNQLGVGSNDQWPIDYDGPITPIDIARDMQNGYRTREIVFEDRADANDTFILGTINEPIFDERGWHLRQRVLVNTVFEFEDVVEEDGTVYSNYTNAQLALKMAHEFGHLKEDQKILKMVLAESGTLIQESGNDPAVVRKLMEQKVAKLNEIMNQDLRVKGKVNGTVLFYEVVPNLMTMSILDTLINLNMGHRVPGFRDDDPYPISEGSLYRTYRRAIHTFEDPYDPDWLTFYIH